MNHKVKIRLIALSIAQEPVVSAVGQELQDMSDIAIGNARELYIFGGILRALFCERYELIAEGIPVFSDKHNIITR